MVCTVVVPAAIMMIVCEPTPATLKMLPTASTRTQRELPASVASSVMLRVVVLIRRSILLLVSETMSESGGSHARLLGNWKVADDAGPPLPAAPAAPVPANAEMTPVVALTTRMRCALLSERYHLPTPSYATSRTPPVIVPMKDTRLPVMELPLPADRLVPLPANR